MSSTVCSNQLPQEIYDETVGYFRNDRDTLRACALAFRSLLPASQRLLFTNLSLLLGSRLRSGEYINGPRLERILEDSPHIGSYVEFLEISEATNFEAGLIFNYSCIEEKLASMDAERTSRNKTLAICLPHFHRLKCLSIQYPEAPTALEDTLHQSSLTSIDIHSMPAFILKGCRNIKHLSVNPLDFHGPQHQLSFEDQPTLESLRINLNTNGGVNNLVHNLANSVAGISHLKKLFVIFKESPPSHYMVANLLQGCGKTLEQLVLDPCLDALHNPNAAPIDIIDLSDLSALRRIHIRLAVDHRPGDLTCSIRWFMRIFRTMPSSKQNCLEELVIELNCKSWMLIDVVPWVEMSTFLVTPDRFPCFKKLRINILSFRDGEAKEFMGELENYLADVRRAGIVVELSEAELDSDSTYLASFWPNPSWEGYLNLTDIA